MIFYVVHKKSYVTTSTIIPNCTVIWDRRVHSYSDVLYLLYFFQSNHIFSVRVSYITSTLPYIILIILAIRSFTLPGAVTGILEYVTPKWNRLLTLEIWKDAAKQIIFSLGPACGCVITLSSYNEFHRDCHRDAVSIAIANGITSIFSGRY